MDAAIGHYGRLVFAMVARHLSEDELISYLNQDSDFSEAGGTYAVQAGARQRL